jgi:uncharacterized protein
MWSSIARFILRYKLLLLALLLVITGFMAWRATKVELSYEFVKSIPTDNPKYLVYQDFKRQFGDEGNTVVVGFEYKNLLTSPAFAAFWQLHQQYKQLHGIDNVLSAANAVRLLKDSSGMQLISQPIFDGSLSPDSAVVVFYGLPFYKGLLYSDDAWLIVLRANNEVSNSKARTAFADSIALLAKTFSAQTGIPTHISGLPYTRAVVAVKLNKELNFFLIGSLVLSAITLLLFFRSITATIVSMVIVFIGVIWSVGTLELLDYRITILTGVVPPLVVVIGLPNCIYFFNKFHTSWLETKNRQQALTEMISKMGVVTLFCNITAAIGFAVFALTKSPVLQEFGVVAGINILLLFFISLVVIPVALSFMPPPKPRHLKYLNNEALNRLLMRAEHWSLHHQRKVLWVTALFCVIAVVGIFRLNSVAYVVDDLPQKDEVLSDLKWFEQKFEGVMPLEIGIDTKKKRGIFAPLSNLEKMDSLAAYISNRTDMARPLSLVEGLKFAEQTFLEGDSSSYRLPSESDLIFLKDYLSTKKNDGGKKNTLQQLLNSFVDSNQQIARLSVNMKDVGSAKLPGILDTMQQVVNQLFDTAKYRVTLTGSSVTFLEGSTYITQGLKESIVYAFLLIAISMMYLFRDWRIVICSLIPNTVPLLITAGVMGWAGVPLKPSTVLVFSVALGISIDIKIRFLVNYKQELPNFGGRILPTLSQTIRHTGVSIIYTSVVLIAGFIIFCFSDFGGTFALGWLTSLTLVIGTITNLVLLPVLMLMILKDKQ